MQQVLRRPVESALAALIRVMQEGIGLAAPPDRRDQRVGDELGCHGSAHRPSEYPAREQVDHRRNVEPSFGRSDIGEAAIHFWFGLSAVNWRSSTLPAMTDRSP
jgi:peptidoglycan/xylan/chitin deacetylase (PgdA/CDA1 family)